VATDIEYAALIQTVLQYGRRIETRNSQVKRIKAYSVDFDTTPLVATRKTAWKTALREWEWFMSGSSNLDDLHPSVHSWWKEWANSSGNVLFNYSKQFRRFRGETGVLDQIEFLIDGIKSHPYSRRNVITTWNAQEMAAAECPITNCHNTVTQAFVEDGELSLVTYQRSVDVVCGLPHNWIQQWAFLMWLAHRTGYGVGTLHWIGGDVHIYDQHLSLAERIVEESTSVVYNPELVYEPMGATEFKADHFRLDCEYRPVLTDKAEMIT
jgi:thymidylate synthase